MEKRRDDFNVKIQGRSGNLPKLGEKLFQKRVPRYKRKFVPKIKLANIYDFDKEEEENETFGENISCILPKRLFCGNFVGANDIEMLFKHGIRTVVNFGKPIKNTSDRINYLYFPIKDNGEENLDELFPQFFQIMEESTSKSIPVLVCCVFGISRSPTMTISYLMKKNMMTYEEALSFVQERRSIADPNIGFVFQLKNLEEELNIKKKRTFGSGTSVGFGMKKTTGEFPTFDIFEEKDYVGVKKIPTVGAVNTTNTLFM